MITVPIKTPEGRLYIPTEHQRAFHGSAAQNKAMIGAFGSGKSLPGAVEAVLQSIEPRRGHGGEGLICRYDWHELKATSWKMFVEVIPEPIRRLCKITEGHPPTVTFPNGFVVRGFNMKNHQKLQSMNLSWAWFDEVNEDGVTEKHYLQVQGRLRNSIGRRCLWMTGNPAGRNWIYTRFFAHLYDKTAKKYENHEGFLSKTKDNPYLPEDYIPRMQEVYPEDWLDKFLSGSFDVFEGQILDFNPDIHLVHSFPVPALWPRYFALDHGITHPTAAVWAASDFEGNLIVYREHAQRNLTPAENARMILAAEKGEPEVEWRVIDPATTGRETAGGVIQRIIDQYIEAGLYCQEGNNDLPGSITLLRQLMWPDPERRFPAWHHYKGLPGSPKLFFMTCCPGLKWEAEQWAWLDLKAGQLDRQRVRAINDDRIAALRYLVMQRPREAVPEVRKTPGGRVEEILAELAEEREARRDGYSEWVGSERIR